jgi:DNA-binding transcriptional LysR family regulator
MRFGGNSVNDRDKFARALPSSGSEILKDSVPASSTRGNCMRGVTLRQLKAFSLIAHHRSFMQAAAELHLTPSAVSLQIKELEESTGLPLFARNGKGVTLTRAGELLLVDVHRALAALQHADDTLTRLRSAATGVVSVGMVSNAKYFLPKVLARFHERHRDVELQLSVGNREQLVDQIRRGQIDLAIMGPPPADLEARSEAFATHPFGVVAAPEHELAYERSITSATLAKEEFIVRESGSGTRAAMEQFFLDARIDPPRVMEMSSNGAIKQAVMANMGIAFLSLHATGLELSGHQLVTLDVVGLPLIRRWYVVDMESSPLSDAAESLRRFILEHGSNSVAQQFGDNLRPSIAVQPEAATAL